MRLMLYIIFRKFAPDEQTINEDIMKRSGIAPILILLFIVGISCKNTPKQCEEEVDSEWIDSLQRVYQYGICIDTLDLKEYKMKNGDNPAAIFSNLGFSALMADSISRSSKEALLYFLHARQHCTDTLHCFC